LGWLTGWVFGRWLVRKGPLVPKKEGLIPFLGRKDLQRFTTNYGQVWGTIKGVWPQGKGKLV